MIRGLIAIMAVLITLAPRASAQAYGPTPEDAQRTVEPTLIGPAVSFGAGGLNPLRALTDAGSVVSGGSGVGAALNTRASDADGPGI